MLSARDKKLKLSGKSLTKHLRRKQGAHKDVGAAFMLHEIQQDDNPTPRQAIIKYTKVFQLNPRFKVPSRPYIASKYVKNSAACASHMLAR